MCQLCIHHKINRGSECTISPTGTHHRTSVRHTHILVPQRPDTTPPNQTRRRSPRVQIERRCRQTRVRVRVRVTVVVVQTSHQSEQGRPFSLESSKSRRNPEQAKLDPSPSRLAAVDCIIRQTSTCRQGFSVTRDWSDMLFRRGWIDERVVVGGGGCSLVHILVIVLVIRRWLCE